MEKMEAEHTEAASGPGKDTLLSEKSPQIEKRG